MTIFSVAVALHSTTRTLGELTALAGAEPTRSHSIGDPISRTTSIRKANYWGRKSEVTGYTWTLEPHWPSLVPIFESLARADLTGVDARLSIGTFARGSGFAFDLSPEQLSLIHRANCWVWIDSYEDDEPMDLPDDYPYPPGGRFGPPGPIRRLRRRAGFVMRKLNPWGGMRAHARQTQRAEE